MVPTIVLFEQVPPATQSSEILFDLKGLLITHRDTAIELGFTEQHLGSRSYLQANKLMYCLQHYHGSL